MACCIEAGVGLDSRGDAGAIRFAFAATGERSGTFSACPVEGGLRHDYRPFLLDRRTRAVL